MKVFVVKEDSEFRFENKINKKLDYIKDNQFNFIKISYLIAPNNSSLLSSDKSEVVAIIEYDE